MLCFFQTDRYLFLAVSHLDTPARNLTDMSVAGNPNKDFTDTQWGTNYAVERWYPLWFNKVRPVPSGFPSSLSYVGPQAYLFVSDQSLIGQRGRVAQAGT